MTALHRVGLAGLYMTLDAFDNNPGDKAALKAAGLTWTLEERKVTLDFGEGKAQAGLSKLLELAFQLENGFFKLPGLNRGAPPTLEQQWLIYQALLGTFLQFGPHRPTGKKDTLIIEVDDKQLRLPGFAPITRYRHQEAAKDFLTGKGKLGENVELVGWLYPGGSQRHVAWAESTLEEPAELAFCLLFAPVGAIFFHIASRRSGGKARTALVLPTVSSLLAYARLRRFVAESGVLSLTAASPTDAALQLAVLARGQELTEDLQGPIRVMAFGIVAWNKKQKSRTAAYSINVARLPGLRNYELASGIFRNRWQTIAAKRDRKGNVKEPESAFVRPFTAREIIANNVALRRPWYAGFAEDMVHQDTRLALQFERKELYQMTEEAEYDHPNERIFIRTCHEAWRRRLGQLGDRARREHIAFSRLASGEYEKLRVALARCKNATTLRATLTDFWSRAGSLPTLQTGWVTVLPLLEEAHWRKARDLALLALASYQPANENERFDLAQTPTEEAGIEP
ncbi:type I-MYXAN CRISPR-associated Cas8a1/Cmx1 [Methylolobus aquaticus]|nr:type I-MYXAN CRISPR-associated Cas8a1/Cmx1 [Methylolobus aquaticus]